jgi:hypothetical protein
MQVGGGGVHVVGLDVQTDLNVAMMSSSVLTLLCVFESHCIVFLDTHAVNLSIELQVCGGVAQAGLRTLFSTVLAFNRHVLTASRLQLARVSQLGPVYCAVQAQV